MRVTSHCANHPSKEASQRCRSCRKWLCDVCLRRYRGHIYCGPRCRVIGAIRDGLAAALAFARQPLHAAWVIAVVAGASALLLSVVGVKVAELVEISRGTAERQVEQEALPKISARVEVVDEGPRIEVEGPPGTTVLLIRDARPLAVVTCDDEGHAVYSGPDLEEGGGPLQIISLTRSSLELDLPRLPRPTPTTTVTATVVAQRSPSPTEQPSPPQESEGPRFGPTPMVAPPVLQLVHDAGPRIALTFDGNASSNRTSELLDLLHRYNLTVTIFVTGRFIERYPEIIRRAVLSGHEIGNHTYSHPHLTTYAEDRSQRLRTGVTKTWFQRELRLTEEAFVKATGNHMQPLWRAPYGEENRILRGWALEAGYLHVRWSSLQGASLDSHDWVADEHSSLYKSSAKIMERLLKFPKLEGGIILMHMSTEREEPPWEELPIFLAALEKRGVEQTTVTRLLEASPTWSKWLRRADERHREVNGR